MRNNIRTCMRIPQYANIKLYTDGVHLTVTFPVTEAMTFHIEFKDNSMWKTGTFLKQGKWYATTIMDIPYSKIVEANTNIEECVWHYSRMMCNYLKITLREAKVKGLNEEIKQLSFDFK